MASAESQLNGAGDYRILLEVNLSSQDTPGNYSTFWWGVTLRNINNSPSWINSPSYWAANIAGAYREGSFALPSSGPFGDRLLASGYQNVGHDSAGYRPGFENAASIDTPHSNIGDGSVVVWADAPRIPKAPSPPGIPYLYSLLPNYGARVIIPASSDNGGATIDMYLIRLSKNANPEQSPYTDLGISPSLGFGDFQNLDPGTTYYMFGYAHNSQGWTRNNGGAGSFSTQAAAKISKTNAYQNADVFISRGGQWITAAPMVSKAGAWVNVN